MRRQTVSGLCIYPIGLPLQIHARPLPTNHFSFENTEKYCVICTKSKNWWPNCDNLFSETKAVTGWLFPMLFESFYVKPFTVHHQARLLSGQRKVQEGLVQDGGRPHSLIHLTSPPTHTTSRYQARSWLHNHNPQKAFTVHGPVSRPDCTQSVPSLCASYTQTGCRGISRCHV